MCDRSAIAGGKQHIQTQNGHHMPLHIRDGLPYMAIRPFTDIEWETLPHIDLTEAANSTHDLWLPALICGYLHQLITSTPLCSRQLTGIPPILAHPYATNIGSHLLPR